MQSLRSKSERASAIAQSASAKSESFILFFLKNMEMNCNALYKYLNSSVQRFREPSAASLAYANFFIQGINPAGYPDVPGASWRRAKNYFILEWASCPPSLWAARIAYPTELFLHNWDAPINSAIGCDVLPS